MTSPVLFDGLRFERTTICQGQTVYVDAAGRISGRLIGYNQRRNVWLVSVDHPDIPHRYVICSQFYPARSTHSSSHPQPLDRAADDEVSLWRLAPDAQVAGAGD